MRVLLRLVRHIPAERHPETVDEDLSHSGLVVGGREKLRLVLLEVVHQSSNQ
jgi:hypothetical protein